MALQKGVIDGVITRTTSEAAQFQDLGHSINTIDLDGSSSGGLTYTGSSDAEAIDGTSSADTVSLDDGDDTFTTNGGSDIVDGGTGFDTVVVSSTRSQTSAKSDNDGSFTVTVNGDLLDLTNVERLQLTDGTIALDLDGAAGQTYRLYQSAFNRTPDDAGLSHNVNLMDGGLSIFDMANAFIQSAEFQQTYGASIDDATFITLLYNNVLNRAPDDAGLAGWQDSLNGGSTRAEVLFGFSESGENKANVAAAIDDGIWLV